VEQFSIAVTSQVSIFWDVTHQEGLSAANNPLSVKSQPAGGTEGPGSLLLQPPLAPVGLGLIVAKPVWIAPAESVPLEEASDGAVPDGTVLDAAGTAGVEAVVVGTVSGGTVLDETTAGSL